MTRYLGRFNRLLTLCLAILACLPYQTSWGADDVLGAVEATDTSVADEDIVTDIPVEGVASTKDFQACEANRQDEFVLPPKNVDLIGDVRTVAAEPEDDLLDIARCYGLGYGDIVSANPTVDAWVPKEGTSVTLPTRYILPSAPREGIVVNSPEMRLYYYPPAAPGAARKVVTHPVSVGRVDWNTPLGITRVQTKVVDPPWHPPASIRKEALEKGTPLPVVVPAGPDNPLGKYAMRLALAGSYLIHGTDKPFGIGMQVTHGCMRLYPEDIESLFKQVPVNTKVNLVNEPIKLGWFADALFVEVTPALEQDTEHQEEFIRQAKERALDLVEKRNLFLDSVAWNAAVKAQLGIPVMISKPKSDTIE